MVKTAAPKHISAAIPPITSLFFASPDGVLLLSAGGEILYANPRASVLLNQPNELLVGSTFPYGLKNTDAQEIETVLPEGDRAIIELRVNAYEIAKEIGYMVLLRDISQLRQRSLLHSSFYDNLTNLPNRMLFKDRLKLELFHADRNNRHVVVMFLNIDRFKSINDALGDNVGDKILKSLAEKLKDVFRKSDTVARVGNDEFGFILPGVMTPADTNRIVEKVYATLGNMGIIDGHEIFLSASLGITLYPDDGRDVENLLKNTSIAMKLAKDQGRNAFQYYTPAFKTMAAERMDMEKKLVKALEGKEFEVYYQPQIDLQTRNIAGAEGLLRWNAVGTGIIPAGQFISCAEETGLIFPIGDWVFETACQQIRAWMDKDIVHNLQVMINISPLQFTKPNFIDFAINTIRKYDIPTALFGIEITESMLMKDIDYTTASLRRLKDIGISIAIDDFGTGYSSLSYLRRFPLDVIKIDRSFVKDVTVNRNDAEIATAIVRMAKALNLKVIAEGVETKEQLNFFRELQCDQVQGFLFSKAIPGNEFAELLARPTIFNHLHAP